MPITRIAAFAHLTDADIGNLAVELDAIRLGPKQQSQRPQLASRSVPLCDIAVLRQRRFASAISVVASIAGQTGHNRPGKLQRTRWISVRR